MPALLSTKSFYFFESTIDSSPLYSLKPAALFYLYTRAIESNNSFFYFVVLHSTKSSLQSLEGNLSQKHYFSFNYNGNHIKISENSVAAPDQLNDDSP